MAKNNIKSKKGFTIIEVVLVLAIAGLIFLMVFIALPALQSSQRDTQRRDDMARFSSQLNQYSANNRGKIPSDQKEWNSFLLEYLAKVDTSTNSKTTACKGVNTATIDSLTPCLQAAAKDGTNQFVDPDGDAYIVQYVGSMNAGANANMARTGTFNHRIYVYDYAQCDGESVVTSTGARKVAISFRLESAGVFCGTN